MTSAPDPSQTSPRKQDQGQGLTSAPAPMSGLEWGAVVISAIWIILSGTTFLFGASAASTPGFELVNALAVMVLPVLVIWVATVTARNTRALREENARLRVAIDALRHNYITQNKTADPAKTPLHPMLLQRLDALAANQARLEAAANQVTEQHSDRVHSSATQSGNPDQVDDQPGLALGTPVEDLAGPLSNENFIRALHFPETAEDKVGFTALRLALRDRQVSQLVQASQDVLTLLSQEGIYMDDLRPDLPRPEFWRAFAKGERGRAVAPLGGIRDRSSLALTAGRMKEDAIFRDAAHHFLRRFDTNFVPFAERATDAELTDFANTRTGRAFMLLGRVAGTFD